MIQTRNELKTYEKRNIMKKLLLLSLCALFSQGYASEAGDQKALEIAAKEAARKAKNEKRRQALNAEAAKIAESKPKQAAKLIKKSIGIDPNNPTGYYIAAGVAGSSEEFKQCLANAAMSDRKSIYKEAARIDLNKINSEPAMAAFIKELDEKMDTDICLEDLLSWIKEKSPIFPDKEDFIGQTENVILSKNASWLDTISKELVELKKRR